MYAQITLTVQTAKKIIAESIFLMPQVQSALGNGKIVLKGGTTVSQVAERMVQYPLRISGRVSTKGTKGALKKKNFPHSILIQNGRVEPIDDCFSEVVKKLSKNDIVIIGANALDIYGQTAIMLGSPLGGEFGKSIAGLIAQGCKIIIACGLEKLIPTPIQTAVQASGMNKMDWAMGMAVGLMPLYGEVVTEKIALERIASIQVTVIGAGGIYGAEGANTLVLDGATKEVKKALSHIISFQNTEIKNVFINDTQECKPGSYGCKEHYACAWRKNSGKLLV